MKRLVSSFLLILMTFSILMPNPINVKAHESLLNIEYDSCTPDGTGDGENEVWYYLCELGYSAGPNFRYYHLDDDTITIKYFFEESDLDGTGYTWTTDVSNELAQEIKTAYINSVLEWNDVYYYSYDSTGNRITNRVINIVEGTEEDHNLSIYPMRNDGNGTIAATAPDGTVEVINTGKSNIQHLHYNEWIMLVNVSYFYENDSTNLTSEEVELIRKNTGEHEMGHILGLDDVDVCCTRSSQAHHEEILMGYGDLLDRQENVTYKDIAGVAIIRGFHDDNDHVWMRRDNTDGTVDLICSLCNGVLFNVDLDSNGTTYEGEVLREFESCTHHSGSNSEMLLVAADGERDFFKCQYCRHIDTVKVGEECLLTGSNTNISSTKQIFAGDSSYIKLNVRTSIRYDFIATSTSALDVTLYDSNFNIINVSPTSTNSGTTKKFCRALVTGTYYLKVAYSNTASSGTISITIKPHSHTYDGWTYYNNSTHIESCCCGLKGTATAVHSIRASEVVNNKANCMGCGYMLDLRYDMAVSTPDSAAKVSVNGSYILPSGIIVLVDEDVEAYLNGTLVFYDKDDLPVTQ